MCTWDGRNGATFVIVDLCRIALPMRLVSGRSHRSAHFDPAFYQTDLGSVARVATTYSDTPTSIDSGQNRIFDLRVPGAGEFMSSLAAGVARAQSGEATAQEALNAVAAEWKAIGDRIGLDRVRDAYHNVVAL